MNAFRVMRHERVLRRLMHGYWRFSRGLTLGVRGMVLDGEGRIFLVKHGYVSGWHLPGGGVEPGETLREALGRELIEEGNIEILDPPLFHGMFLNAAVSRRDHIALFVVRDFRQGTPPQPTYEIIDHRFFARHELPADVTPGTRRRIAEVLEGANVTERW
jgi:ADP-ribose pyrophosphatase YjhB (NUDIX family)